ncbi:hypothetical protein AAG906_022494 [Vitis piasezkii]
MGTRQAELDRGHAILNKLENVCLLERCENGKCVKMHDVIRDMAINITRSRFMVKTERYLEDLPNEGLPNFFFVNLQGLRVLDLSYTNIEFLPDFIYDMVNLRALFLCYCDKLNHVPSLAKLKELRELDLSWNVMETIPDLIDKLVLLKQFTWTSYKGGGVEWVDKVGDPFCQFHQSTQFQ